jgi:hypothetical protein
MLYACVQIFNVMKRECKNLEFERHLNKVKVSQTWNQLLLTTTLMPICRGLIGLFLAIMHNLRPHASKAEAFVHMHAGTDQGTRVIMCVLS